VTTFFLGYVCRIPPLGSGSDYSPFCQRAGVPSADIRYVFDMVCCKPIKVTSLQKLKSINVTTTEWIRACCFVSESLDHEINVNCNASPLCQTWFASSLLRIWVTQNYINLVILSEVTMVIRWNLIFDRKCQIMPNNARPKLSDIKCEAGANFYSKFKSSLKFFYFEWWKSEADPLPG